MTIISHTHKFIFIHIPKCGGSSVEAAFQPHVRWGDFVIGSTQEGEVLHQQVFGKLYGIKKHSTATEIRNAIGSQFEEMQVVALVREPLKVVESYYKFSKTIHEWIASHYLDKVPGRSIAMAKLLSLDLIRQGQLEKLARFNVLNLHFGTVKLGVVSDSFESFLEAVCDNRWSDYFTRFLKDERGRVLASEILKLEDTDRIEGFFREKAVPGFKLGHNNASARVETVWNERLRSRYLHLMRTEYEFLGYGSGQI